MSSPVAHAPGSDHVFLVEARSVSDGGALPVAHAPGSDRRCFYRSPERERRGSLPVAHAPGSDHGVSIGARSVSDGGAHPSLTLRALTVISDQSRRTMRVSVFLLIAMVCYSPTWAAEKPRNLALDGRAKRSESLGDLTPEKAIDGKMETRWSGIPGHNQGVWFQIDWPKPIEIGEVIVHQYDRFVYEFDVQTRTDKTDAWRTVQHFGRPGERLPKVVPCRFKPAKVSGIRIGNITNGPSFTEVIVHQQPLADGLVTQLASDLRGHFIGVTTDSLGNTPIEGAEVTLSGYSKGGPWQTTVPATTRACSLPPCPWGFPRD